MARFSALVRGTRALKTISFQIWDQEPKLALRPLNGLEEGDAIAGAIAYAKGKGVVSSKAGDSLFDLGLMAEVLFRGCVDTENPAVTFFASVGEILEHLDADRIALLWEQHQGWQDECTIRPRGIDGNEFMALVMRAAEEGDGGANSPFAGLRPVTRASCERILARLYVNSLTPRSPTGSASENATSAASPSNDAPPADMPALLDDANAMLDAARAAEPDAPDGDPEAPEPAA